MSQRFVGKVAVITGSSSGIGKEIARRLVQEGARVVINSRDSSRVEAALRDIGANGEAIPCASDISTEGGAITLIRSAVNAFGGLDILVNNAGISMIRASEELTLADWQRCLDVDLTGTFLCSREAGRFMRGHGGGSIVNVASIASFVGLPNRAAYAAAKYGVIGLTETLAAEWAQYKIRVNAVAPAFIATPMDDVAMATGDYSADDVTNRTPMGRKGLPEEVANAVLFLGSEEASYITGSTLRVDGGWLAFGGWGNASAPVRVKLGCRG